MKAIKRQGAGKFSVINMEKPTPEPHEVVVKVFYAGICGSDIHRIQDGNEKWDQLILGHEFSGIVEELGSEVTNVRVGERVSAAPLLPCHHCEYCLLGQFSQCSDYSFIGSRRNGAFAEFLSVPSMNLVRLPENLDMKSAALLEPTTVVLHPLMLLDKELRFLETAVVTGLGAIGLLAVQLLKFLGVKNIVASDIVEDKIALARKSGATFGINVLHQNLEEITDELGGANLVFESSGSVLAKKSAIRVARSRGTILLVGTNPQAVSFEANEFERVTRKELRLLGSWMNYSSPWPGKEWETAAWLIDQSHLDLEGIITHEIFIDDADYAADVISDNNAYIKILFKM